MMAATAIEPSARSNTATATDAAVRSTKASRIFIAETMMAMVTTSARTRSQAGVDKSISRHSGLAMDSRPRDKAIAMAMRRTASNMALTSGSSPGLNRPWSRDTSITANAVAMGIVATTIEIHSAPAAFCSGEGSAIEGVRSSTRRASRRVSTNKAASATSAARNEASVDPRSLFEAAPAQSPARTLKARASRGRSLSALIQRWGESTLAERWNKASRNRVRRRLAISAINCSDCTASRRPRL